MNSGFDNNDGGKGSSWRSRNSKRYFVYVNIYGMTKKIIIYEVQIFS